MITKQEIDNMSPEELEAFKRKASVAIVKRFAAIFLFKLGVSFALRSWSRRLKERS